MARWTDHDGITRSKSFTRQSEAQRHVTQVTTDLTTGHYVDSRKSAAAFGTVAEEWLTAKTPGLKPSTVGGYRSLLDATVLPRWGETSLHDITHTDIQEWITYLCADPAARTPRTLDPKKRTEFKPLSPRRVIHAHGMVKQVLAFAVRTRRLATNPADDIELPRLVHREDLALTHAQVHAIAKGAGDAGPIVLLLAYSGLRFGEAAALRVADVDLKRRRIMVSKAVAEVAKVGLVEGTTKTHQSRSVPILTTELVDALTDVVEGRKPSEYVFPAPDGGPMRNSFFRWRLDQGSAAAGVEGVSIKTLRHTAGSLALDLPGTTVVTVSKLLGHRNVTTTMNVYMHMLPDGFDDLTKAMDKASRKAARKT